VKRGIFCGFSRTGDPSDPSARRALFCCDCSQCGAEAVVDIVRFGQKQIELLRRFLPFRDGTPYQAKFARRLTRRSCKLISVSEDVIAIDGETSRRSADKRRGKVAILASAFASAPACGARPGQSGGQIQRDRRPPASQAVSMAWRRVAGPFIFPSPGWHRAHLAPPRSLLVLPWYEYAPAARRSRAHAPEFPATLETS
jgi:hypothetical protein